MIGYLVNLTACVAIAAMFQLSRIKNENEPVLLHAQVILVMIMILINTIMVFYVHRALDALSCGC